MKKGKKTTTTNPPIDFSPQIYDTIIPNIEENHAKLKHLCEEYDGKLLTKGQWNMLKEIVENTDSCNGGKYSTKALTMVHHQERMKAISDFLEDIEEDKEHNFYKYYLIHVHAKYLIQDK